MELWIIYDFQCSNAYGPFTSQRAAEDYTRTQLSITDDPLSFADYELQLIKLKDPKTEVISCG